MKRHVGIKIERKPLASGQEVFFVSLLAILAAFLVAGIFFRVYGVSPIKAYQLILHGSLGSRFGLAETVRRAIPLLLCGVGLTIAFRALFWNIGAEGQLLMGAVAATGIALFSGLPDPLLLPAMFIGGFIGGAIWGFIPAILKVILGLNDVITTLMMNYIAIYFIEWLIHGPWKGPSARGFAYSDTFPRAAWLPTIYNTRIHWPTLMLGLFLAVMMYVMVTHTRSGFEIRVIGENPDAAKFAGISQLKTTLLVMLISGGFAGLAGVGEIAGIHLRLLGPTNISMGYGYTAIIVAWLARRNPLAVIITSFLFGAIMTGGDVIKVSLGLPFQLINVFNGLILFFLIGSEIILRYKISFLSRR
ncbi:MAG TPA: ABC transporter permease [Candidatus Atribacteria bacterium]|nr:ABC transporter permease [Candidatus Atribacteria bacterium]